MTTTIAAQTLAEALADARTQLHTAGVADAELEAELLLRQALGCTREALFVRLREATPRAAALTFESFIARRIAREPTPYITGHTEFYGLDLECTPAALIPRPETELLVDLVVDWVGGQGSRVRELTIVDVGTGSGAIAVAIAVNAPAVRVVAIDTSRVALALARRNARAHGVSERIDLVQGSLLSALRQPVDVIVANLPYIPTQLYRELLPELRDHEPEAALHAGSRGTEIIEALIEQAPALLRPGGLLLAEHQCDQGDHLRRAAQATFPTACIETKRDLAGQERALAVSVPGPRGR